MNLQTFNREVPRNVRRPVRAEVQSEGRVGESHKYRHEEEKPPSMNGTPSRSVRIAQGDVTRFDSNASKRPFRDVRLSLTCFSQVLMTSPSTFD
jgi:hypothetical protein